MSYLFPVNPINKSSDPEKISAIEKIGDEARENSQDLDYQSHKEEKELEEKVRKLVNHSELSKALELTDLDLKTKSKLLEIAKNTAATFLQKELLTIARNILSISNTQEDTDELDDYDLTLSEQLAKVVMKIAKEKPSSKTVKNKVDRAKPLDDKSAGFLVHYCKDILKQKICIHKNKFKSQKLTKEELSKLLKK